MKKTIVVVPTYNEIGNIYVVYEKIFTAVNDLQLLIVDDNSPDGTGAAADDLANKDSRVSVIHREEKRGLGSAYIHGMQYAVDQGYELVIAMDADLSHDPANLPKMISLMDRCDLVIGSRYVKDGGMVNWGVGRFFISRFANMLCRLILGIKQEDCSGGFKCYRSDLLKKIGMENLFSYGYSFQVEILYRAIKKQARIVEIPIIFVNRHVGESKLTLNELIQFGWTILKLRFCSWFGKI